MFPNFFKTIIVDADNNISIVEPSAKLMVGIYRRLNELKDENGNIDLSRWNGLYVFAALHIDGRPAIVDLSNEFNSSSLFNYSLERIYCELDKEQFFDLIDYCLSKVPYKKLDEWYKAMDDTFIISKKKADEVKND